MGPGRTGVKGVIRDRAEARAREQSRRTQEITALNAQMEKSAITARTFREDEEAARKEKEQEEERGAKERYRRRRWRELKERATGGSAGFGHLREIGVHGFVEAVENEQPHIWVVVHIYELVSRRGTSWLVLMNSILGDNSVFGYRRNLGKTGEIACLDEVCPDQSKRYRLCGKIFGPRPTGG